MSILPIFGSIEEPIDEKLCFIIMPFSKQFNELYEDSILPSVEKNNLNCVRADEIYDIRPIMSDIWTSTCKSKIIISDLTNKNPNVLYETGIAHTIGKDVILLTQTMEDIPFDLRHLRVIKYEFTPRGVQKLENDLQQMIKSILGKNPHPHKIAKKLIGTDSENRKNLINEIVTKPASEKGKWYSISAKEGYTLEGFIESDDVFKFSLFDDFNKEKYEDGRVSKSFLTSTNILKYNFHFEVKKDKILNLFLSGDLNKRIEYKLNLSLIKNQESKKKIIWDEMVRQVVNAEELFVWYPTSNKKGDFIEICVSSKKPCTCVFMDSENYTLERRNKKYETLLIGENVKVFSKRYLCQKDDTYHLKIYRNVEDELNLNTLITIEDIAVGSNL